MFRRRAVKDASTARSGTAAEAAVAGGGKRTDGRSERKAPHRAPQPQPAGAEPFTYIQRGTTIEGQLVARGRVRVHGVVKGDVRVDGALEVAEAGLIEGATIEADEVKIIGRVVVKSLVARGKVEIWDGGELIGDVRAASLDIEEGARFTGRSEMAGADSAADHGQAEPAAEAADRGATTEAAQQPRRPDASAADTLLESAEVRRSTERL